MLSKTQHKMSLKWLRSFFFLPDQDNFQLLCFSSNCDEIQWVKVRGLGLGVRVRVKVRVRVRRVRVRGLRVRG